MNYLKSHLETHFPHYLKLLVEHADRALGQCFQFSMPWDMESTWVSHSFENTIDWDYQMADDPEWTFMLSRSGFVLHLAKRGSSHMIPAMQRKPFGTSMTSLNRPPIPSNEKKPPGEASMLPCV
jgi:hypothetical protein